MQMEDKFTVEEIRKYILSKDSMGDIAYYLSAENIRKANAPNEPVEEDSSLDVIFPDTEEMYCPSKNCQMPTLHSLQLNKGFPDLESSQKWTCNDCGHQLQ